MRLARQIDKTHRNIAAWPRWMRREAGIPESSLNPTYMRQAAQELLDDADRIEAERQ